MTMESFPFFFKIRTATFMCIMLLSFLWLILLSLEIFTRWSISDRISHSLMILFVLANTITLIMLPMLILVQFRIWLDAARLFLLIVLQIGSATAGTIWSPKIQCPDRTPNGLSVCQLIDVYTMMAFWVIPVILVFYSAYFGVVVYLQSRIPVVVEPKLKGRRSGDPEIGSTDSLSLWREKLKEIVGVQSPNSDGSNSSRSLALPPVLQARQSLPPHSSVSQGQLFSPTVSRHQQTTPSLPLADQQPVLPCALPANRHRSLPAFKHGVYGAHLPPLITLTPSRPHASSTSASHPQTPSSCSHSMPLPATPHNHSFNVCLDVADAQLSQGCSRHLSMMPMSPSLRERQSGGGSPTARPARARLSKPPPVHLM